MSKTKYVNFSKEEIERARQTDIATMLRSQGETVKRSGSEFVWLDGGKKVTIRGNVWFHQYELVGGDSIDFVQKFYGKSFPEAVMFLNGGGSGSLILSQPVRKQEKPFALPPKNDTMRRVFAYLCDTRGIDREVLQTFVRKGMVYESADFHNAVFVGFDKDGIARHAHKRGSHSQSNYKGNADGSNPAYSFHWNGGSGKLYLFEAPIDMLSYISMNKENWQQHSYAAACSVSDLVLFQCMKDMGNIDTVCLCLDNDEAGQAANRRISAKLKEQGVEYEILIPTAKDWNEDLLSDEVDLLSDYESEGNLCQA